MRERVLPISEKSRLFLKEHGLPPVRGLTEELTSMVEPFGFLISGLVMGFGFVAFCYLVALIAVAFCIFFAIYTVICIDELKTDYKNPINQCESLNKLVLPEYIVHFTYTFLFLTSLQSFAVFWNAPLVVYHVMRYINRPVMREPGIYDPTTILNHDELRKANREGWVKLGFYLISFFYYLYAMIYTLVTS